MARVQIATQGWGWVSDIFGDGLSNKIITINGPVYTLAVGGTTIPVITTNASGLIPGWIEEGTYTITVDAISQTVEAVAGATVTGIGAVIRAAAAQSLQEVRWDSTNGSFAWKNPFFRSPNDHGAIGDGVADDTAAVQAAANAAIALGRDLVLNPTVTYKITATINLIPPAGTSYRAKIRGIGPTPITWAGGSGTDAARKYVFGVQGMKRSRIEHVSISIPAASTYVHGWDLDNIPGVAPAGTYGSLSQITFDDCHVFGSTGNTGCGGWRIGHTDTASSDFSFINWDNCGTAMGTAPASSFHILNEGSNSLNNNIFGGYAYFCAVAVTNRPTTGAAATGNGSMFINAFGTSHCTADFDIAGLGTYTITGGRFEVGQRFLNINLNGSTAGADVRIVGATLAGYAPSDGIIFYADGGSGVYLDALEVRPALSTDPDYTAAMITLGGSSAQRGFFAVRGGRYRVADPFFTITGAAAWSLDLVGMRYIDSTLHAIRTFRNYMSVPSTDTSDVLTLAITGGSSGGQPQIALQAADTSLAAAVRGRLGYDGTGPVLDGGAARTASIKSNGVQIIKGTTDSRVQFLTGRIDHRTAPGAYPYTVLLTDYAISISTAVAGRSALLPSAATAGSGHSIIIKDKTNGAATNNFTITPNGADTIDLAASKILTVNGQSVRLMSDGVSNWEVM